MAFVNNIDEDEENTQGMNNSEESSSQSSPTSSGAGSGGGTTSSAMSSPKAAPVAKPAASGNGPGFNNYYKANQGIAQARLNNAASANVANQGKQATNAVNQATTSFGQKVDAGTLANRENAVQDVTDVTNAARGLTAAPAPVATTPTTPAATPPQATAGLATAPTNPITGKAEATPAAAPTAAPVAQATASAPLTDAQTNRFGEVINASYKGPESLRQAGLYQNAADKTGTAQNTLNNTKTAAGREDMLKQMYQNGGEYGTGLNKLDSALLNANKQGVQSLQDTAKAQGNLGQKLDQAQIGSANLATNRTAEINKIKEDARTAFSSGKTAEEKATEDRMDAMLVTPVKDANGNPIMKPDGTPMTQWDQLPESFRDIIRNKKTANQQLLDTKIADYTAANGEANFLPEKAAADAAKKVLEQAQAAYGATKSYVRDMSTQAGMTYEDTEATPAALAQMEQASAAYNAAKGAYDTKNNAYQKGLSDLKSNFNMDAVNFNPLEAQILGIESGEGLFNLGENAIVTGQADREKLISRDEQLRQSVLAQLAGLDQSNRLDTNLRYDDASKAGTQNILDSLDTQGTRAALDEAEQAFEDTADKTDITGTGSKKVSRGNAFGKKTKTYNASITGNAADFLKQAGYDFDSQDASGNPEYSKDLLNAVMATAKQYDGTDVNDLMKQDAQAQLGASAAGATAGSAFGPWGALVGAVLGNITSSGTIDPNEHAMNLINGFAPGVGEQIQGIRNGIGDSIATPISVIPGLGGVAKDIRGMISGIDTKAMAEMGTAEAKEYALQDLQRKYQEFLSSQGYQNRANVVNNDQSNARIAALTNLMNGFDKTNT